MDVAQTGSSNIGCYRSVTIERSTKHSTAQRPASVHCTAGRLTRFRCGIGQFFQQDDRRIAGGQLHQLLCDDAVFPKVSGIVLSGLALKPQDDRIARDQDIKFEIASIGQNDAWVGQDFDGLPGVDFSKVLGNRKQDITFQRISKRVDQSIRRIKRCAVAVKHLHRSFRAKRNRRIDRRQFWLEPQ